MPFTSCYCKAIVDNSKKETKINTLCARCALEADQWRDNGLRAESLAAASRSQSSLPGVQQLEEEEAVSERVRTQPNVLGRKRSVRTMRRYHEDVDAGDFNVLRIGTTRRATVDKGKRCVVM